VTGGCSVNIGRGRCTFRFSSSEGSRHDRGDSKRHTPDLHSAGVYAPDRGSRALGRTAVRLCDRRRRPRASCSATYVSLAADGNRSPIRHRRGRCRTPAARFFHPAPRLREDWGARARGLAGILQRGDRKNPRGAAHPTQGGHNLEIGDQRTALLRGWIPASVANDAAAAGRRDGAPVRRPGALYPR